MTRATRVWTIPGYRLHIRYADGTAIEYSMADMLEGPLFGQLADAGAFARVRVDELGGIEWENGASLAPEFVAELARLAPNRS